MNFAAHHSLDDSGMLHHLDMSLVLCTSVPVPKIKVFSSKPLVLLIWMAGLVPVDVSTRVTVAPAIYYNLKRCGGNTFGTGFRRTGRIMPLDMLLSTAISISLSFLARIIPGLKRFHPILLVIYAVRITMGTYLHRLCPNYPLYDESSIQADRKSTTADDMRLVLLNSRAY